MASQKQVYIPLNQLCLIFCEGLTIL